jgi:hypothetical protein
MSAAAAGNPDRPGWLLRTVSAGCAAVMGGLLRIFKVQGKDLE